MNGLQVTDRAVRIRPVAGLLLALWCGLVWFLSAQADPTDVIALSIDLPDWVFHFGEYAAGGVLAAAALRGPERAERVVLALGFCALYALSDEWHQSFVPGRDPSGTDVAADVAGACVGVLLRASLEHARAVRKTRVTSVCSTT